MMLPQEANFDYVYVYAGHSEVTGRPVSVDDDASFIDTNIVTWDGGSLPDPAAAPTSLAVLRFTSDGSVVRNGFFATFECVSTAVFASMPPPPPPPCPPWVDGCQEQGGGHGGQGGGSFGSVCLCPECSHSTDGTCSGFVYDQAIADVHNGGNRCAAGTIDCTQSDSSPSNGGLCSGSVLQSFIRPITLTIPSPQYVDLILCNSDFDVRYRLFYHVAQPERHVP